MNSLFTVRLLAICGRQFLRRKDENLV